MMTRKEPIAAGKSSFGLIEADELFAVLGLKEDTALLDVGCGTGAYCLAAAGYIGEKGRIYAVDLWQEGVSTLAKEAARQGLRQIDALVADATVGVPLRSQSVNYCLMATILHDLLSENTHQGALREAKRLLMPDGLLAVIEFKKIEGPPGPPLRIRISAAELESIVSPYGFQMVEHVGVGPYNYLSLFTHRR